MNNVNTTVDFSVLKLLPTIYKQIETMQNKIFNLEQQITPKYDLSKRADVRRFLGISDSTIAKYMREQIFKEGYHFFREIKGSKSIIIFVSGAIEEFKKSKEK
ncbi:MAG: hypothetical protein PHT94_04705 [Candidatus Nanoarchaeia archaeon]|uniref:hypothetical protein n=1 Tax=Aliarcobacter cryaerophilus TaxID=28198 RepID=UPI00164BD6C0|nr:hypothetical protein [Aliarcobacter cryaerophilus]MDD3264164.1 hypothetical protein [Candidatus Nanoarchaeia archaeon]QNK85402.1 hypothetical protein HOO31_01950 [Aliarcobacter cryaerophilus]